MFDLSGVASSLSLETNWKDPVEEAEVGLERTELPREAADVAASRLRKIELKLVVSSRELLESVMAEDGNKVV